MSALAVARRAPRPVLVVLAVPVGIALLLLAGWIAGAIGYALLWVAVLAGVALVPCGVLYGLVAQTQLAFRRRAARRSIGAPLSARAELASGGRTRLQVAEQALAVALLAMAVLGIATWTVLTQITDRPGYVDNNTSVEGNLMGALGQASLGFALIAVAAIPVAAVITTKRIHDRAVLAGEAFALATHSSGARRIRAGRVIGLIDLGLYAAFAVAAIIVVLSSV